MALWGSQRVGMPGPSTGSVILPGPVPQPALPQFNPLRFEQAGLIDVPAPNAQQGRAQDAVNAPIGPFAVTLSPLTRADGQTIATATGDNQVVTDYAALVEWGRGGAKFKALVDWPVNGGTFVVAGDSLVVSMWAIIPPQALTTNEFRNRGYTDIAFGAHATPVRAGFTGNMPPRRTMVMPSPIANGGGTSGEIFVPPFSRRWHFQWNNLVSQGAWVLNFLYRRFGNTFAQDIYIGGSGTRSVLDSTIPGPWELPTGTQTMVMNNNTGVALSVGDGALIFDLDLGG